MIHAYPLFISPSQQLKIVSAALQLRFIFFFRFPQIRKHLLYISFSSHVPYTIIVFVLHPLFTFHAPHSTKTFFALFSSSLHLFFSLPALPACQVPTSVTFYIYHSSTASINITSRRLLLGVGRVTTILPRYRIGFHGTLYTITSFENRTISRTSSHSHSHYIIGMHSTRGCSLHTLTLPFCLLRVLEYSESMRTWR